MPFNTYTFVVFLIAVMIIHHSLRSWKAQKTNLLISSYLFYAAWNPVFIVLLFLSTLCDWLIAHKIYACSVKSTRKRYVTVSLLLNLGLLSFFKYGNFMLDNMIEMLDLIGISYQPLPLDIVLPVGISFYTFQTLSYTLDVYREKIKPGHSFLDYALYVSFFPQLVAGPIVRANDFLPQCEQPRKADLNQLGWGLSLLTIGLFMKVILADTIFAPVVDQVYANPKMFGNLETWVAIFSFSGQIFCDFGGYSTCAIGIALCLGFVLPDNFKSPYAALGVRDFWQRWHISLSTWLRDYLYISLGGNRGSQLKTSINLMLTMLIGGLWHGASWLFVIWGGLHGLYLVVERQAGRFVTQKMSGVTKILLIISTYLLVSVTWVFFRAHDLDNASQIISNLAGHSITQQTIDIENIFIALVASLALLIWQICLRNKTLECFYKSIHPLFRALILSVQLISLYLFASGDDRAFIYFQF